MHSPVHLQQLAPAPILHPLCAAAGPGGPGRARSARQQQTSPAAAAALKQPASRQQRSPADTGSCTCQPAGQQKTPWTKPPVSEHEQLQVCSWQCMISHHLARCCFAARTLQQLSAMPAAVPHIASPTQARARQHSIQHVPHLPHKAGHSRQVSHTCWFAQAPACLIPPPAQPAAIMQISMQNSKPHLQFSLCRHSALPAAAFTFKPLPQAQ